jgi:hypothetical protein
MIIRSYATEFTFVPENGEGGVWTVVYAKDDRHYGEGIYTVNFPLKKVFADSEFEWELVKCCEKKDKNMKKLESKELKEIIQSGHINLLIGAGCSLPFLETLGDIEKKMNDEEKKEGAQKEYYVLIKKSKSILEEAEHEDVKLKQTKQNYDSFLSFWIKTIASRSLHIVNKEVNVFTTNFDMFMEDSCERLGFPYNDGFSGQINRNFNVSNFNRIQKYKSLQFDNISDIPLFNIIKLHGSISWKTSKGKIIYSNGSHISDLSSMTGKDFEEEFKKIAVINPTAEKHFETVLDINYASLLRKFALELEKENSILMILGFSLEDKHIKELLYGVMKNNPTLIAIYFSHSKYNEMNDKLEEKKNSNLYMISPEIKKEKFIKYFKNDDWKKFVKNSESEELELIDDIQNLMENFDNDTKEKLNKSITQSFEDVTEYLFKIFSPKREDTKNETKL